MKLFGSGLILFLLCTSFSYSERIAIDPNLIVGKWEYYDAFYNNVRDSGYIQEMTQTIIEFRADGTCEIGRINSDSIYVSFKKGTYLVDTDKELLREKYTGEKGTKAAIKQLSATGLVIEYSTKSRRSGSTTLTYYLRKIE